MNLQRLRARLGEGDRGSAVLEFLVVGILLTLPIFYLVVTMARLQSAAYAVSGAAREAGRMYVTTPEGDSAPARAQDGAALVFADHGVIGQVGMRCSANPCLTRGATVTATAATDVDLPLVPSFLSAVVPTSIHLTSSHDEPVGKYRR
ncbi:pilus assembly protein [Calidifontibacter terrae]